MKTSILLILLLLTACNNQADPSIKDDFQTLCRILTKNKDILPREQRAQIVAQEIDQQIQNAEMHKVLFKIAQSHPSQKYDLLMEGAKEMGVTEFHCPQAKEFYLSK